MSIRKANRKTSNRKDGSVAAIPQAAPATFTPIAGGVNVFVPQGVQASKEGEGAVVGMSLKNTAGTFTDTLVVASVDQFNLTVTDAGLLPGTFHGTLGLSPGMTGIRAKNGGTLVIPSITFP